jgi:hypothetical protein
MSGIIKLVHRTDHPDGPFFTVNEVAIKFGNSKDTIRRWGKQLGIPTHKMLLGDGTNENIFVWLYTEEDISAFEKHNAGIKTGRPRKI